ncbi:hypothetical protein WA158_008314 [Blastocystis sp. Blastoise]
MNALRKIFDMTKEDMLKLSTYCQQEIKSGLKNEVSDLKMLPSFVTNLAKGTEVGYALALDLGGTNCRVVNFHFLGNGVVEPVKEVKKTIPKEYMYGTADELYGFLAQAIKEADPAPKSKLGFTFSFPSEQHSLNDCTLVIWTKGFATAGCVGKSPVKLLEEQLKKLNVDVEIVAICNDTVGTLISRSYYDPFCTIGVILGTGSNVAYYEKLDNIIKYDNKNHDEKMIVNMECGALGDRDHSCLPFSELDAFLDPTTPNVGKQTTEKMMSGLYLGEITRLWIMEMWQKKEIFVDQDLSKLIFSKPHTFDTPILSEILRDVSVDLERINYILKEQGIVNTTYEDRRKIYEIVDLVMTRSARVLASILHAIYQQTNDFDTRGTVGVDGSVYKHVPGYQNKLQHALQMLGLSPVVGLAEDGSGIGAALIAYTA